MRLLDAILDRIRAAVYRAGYRPNPGTILYSPSRAFRDAAGQFWEGWKDGEAIARGEAVDTRTPEEKADSWARIERIATFWGDVDDEDDEDDERTA